MPDWMELKKRVVAGVDPKKFYASYDITFREGHKIPCFNPAHADNTPSLVIGKGGKFKCFGCNIYGSSVVQAYEYIEQLPFNEALLDLAQEYLTDEIIPEAIYEKWHQRLLRDSERTQFLSETRGATKDVIRNLKLGWNGVQYTIPIFDEYGLCVNIRKYRPGAKQGKLVSYKTGFGRARLLGTDVLQKEATVWLVEGEPDYICSISYGLPAITTTGGATHWKPEWTGQFRGVHVVIPADRDTQGQRWANDVADALSDAAASVKILDIPYEDGEKDITDYLLRVSVDELYELEKRTQARSSVSVNKTATTTNGEESDKVHFNEATKSEYYNQLKKLTCQVVGKNVSPYQIPVKATVICEGNKDACMKCPINQKGQRVKLEVDLHSRDVLRLVEVGEYAQQSEIKRLCGIPQACAIEITDEELQDVEKVLLAPSVDDDTITDSHERHVAYYLGHGLKTSGTYNMEIFMVPEPKRQTAVHIITDAGNVYDSLDEYEATPEILRLLRPFKNRSVAAQLEKLYKVELPKVTGILSRDDLHMALDLVYFSPMEFMFQGRPIRKGWLECLIMGDTQQGKTSAAHKLGEFYGLGEIATGEAATFAGLVGGLSKSGDNWTVNWGLLPRNDRRLVILDECSGLSHGDIEKMSRVRSEGRAELVKVISQETHARCRLIWLANPRSGSMLNTYSYGVDAVVELIGKSEDISRFDYVLTIANGETDASVFSERSAGIDELEYTQEQHRNLVLWTWSRTSEQIVFEEGVEDWIINVASKELARDYDPTFPMVQVENIRLKVARVACAIAARMFSTSYGEELQVKKVHAQEAVRFLRKCYDKPSLGYDTYSRKCRHAASLEDEEAVLDSLRRADDEVALVKGLLWQDQITVGDIADLSALETWQAKEIISVLVRNRAITKKGHSYRKTPALISLLKGIERQLDS